MKRNLFFFAVLMVGALLRLSAAPTVLVNGTTRHVLEPGGSVMLSVATAGAGAITHQWFRNGAALPGQTGAALAIASATRADSGWYCADVTDDTGTTRSKPIFLTVAPRVGRLRTWGYASGEFSSPVGERDLIALDSSHSATLALRRDGTVVGWGPLWVNLPLPADLVDIVAVCAGGNILAALRSDGTVRVWGNSMSAALNIPAGLDQVVAIAATDFEMVALKSDGQIVAWGGGLVESIPSGLGNVVAIAAGDSHALAVKADGKVVAWGSNSLGQATVPLSLSGVVAVAAGAWHSVALKSDGTVVAWGNPSSGRGQSDVPAGLHSVVGISAGGYHTLARRGDGSVIAWGSNDYGESSIPSTLGVAGEVSAGGYRSLALDAGVPELLAPAITVQPSGEPVEFGGTQIFRVEATGSELKYRWQVTSIATPDVWNDMVYSIQQGTRSAELTLSAVSFSNEGRRYRCVVSNDLGVVISDPVVLTVKVPLVITSTQGDVAVTLNALTSFSITVTSPVPVTYRWQIKSHDASAWTDILQGDDQASAALSYISVRASLSRHGARIRCVVSNSRGEVESGAFRMLIREALTVTSNQAGLTAVRSGQSISLTGTVTSLLDGPIFYQWKKNNRIIAGATSAMLELPDFESEDAGAYILEATDSFGAVRRITCFVVPDFGVTQVRGWGASAVGQISPPPSLIDAIGLAAGTAHTIALRRDGSLQIFGSNTQGQNPIPNITGKYARVAAFGARSIAVSSTGGVRAWGGGPNMTNNDGNVIAAATNHQSFLLLRNDGTVRAYNWGDASYPYSNPPSEVGEVVAIAMTERASLALKADGTVVSWSVDGTSSQWNQVPAFVANVKAIAAGTRHVLALKNDGTVVAWGENVAGQINVPAGLTEVVEIAAGESTSFARRADGSVVAWGRNSSREATVPVDLGPVLTLAGGGSHSVALRAVPSEPATGLSAWRAAYFSSAELLDAQISGPNADPDGDGLSNLLEYALGLEPRTATSVATTSGLPEVAASATEWTYTYTRPSDRRDVTYAVEISTDLGAWTTDGVTHELVSTDAATGTQTWRARVPLSTGANLFFRLKITQ
jgi:alpha-tubulin suppressor-like RCC1 family protein